MIESNKNNKINNAHRDYWLNRLSGLQSIINLPNKKSPHIVKTYSAKSIRFSISDKQTKELQSFIINHGGNLFICLLASWKVLFYRYTSLKDILLGAHVSNSDLNIQVELWENTLLLRSEIDPFENFNHLYKRVIEYIILDFKHGNYPFTYLKDDLNRKSNISPNNLFNIMLSPKVLSDKMDNEDKLFSEVDIKITFEEVDNQIVFEIIYNSDIYGFDMIEKMISHYKKLLFELINNPNVSVGEIDLIEDEEREFLLRTLRSEIVNYPKEKTIVDLFLEQANKNPDNIAVVFENIEITYKELDKLSNQFANYIINEHGVNASDLVAVMLERSEWIIICLIGVLKSGAAYIPIDPNYPEQRKEYIQKDSQCKTTINSSLLYEFINNIDTYSLNKPENISLRPDSLCYIIYTSGTTGNPKGVMIEHRNVVRLFFNSTPLFDFNENDVWCMFHSFCFDFSVWEMYGALLFGGKLIIVSELIIKDPLEFISTIEKEGVTVLNQTPSAFYNLMESINNSKVSLNLRYIIFGGEALFPKHLKKWYIQYPDVKFINMYGITETTVHVTYKEIDIYDIDSNISNIGNCIPTLSVYILNEFKKLQPVGVVGELYISGKGLARGYLNRPELTDQKFVANPFIPGKRMYSSGDLARWLPDGSIEYIGRKDDQVKIRGHRIELGEIESKLNLLPDIKRAVVLASNHLKGETQLVAYLQPNGTKPDAKFIRQQLEELLPYFMIPSIFMWVEDFPVTSNGKIDKKNLPGPEYVRPDSGTVLKIPQTKLEKDIAKVWSELLKIPVIDVEDNFFEMGGSSLIAQRAVVLLRKKLNTEIPLINIFQNPTVATLAEFLGKNLKVEDKSEKSSNVQNANVTASISKLNPQEIHENVVLKKKTGLVINTTKAQSEILTDCFFGGDDAKRAYNISLSLIFAGKLKYDALELAIQSLVERHESLRSSFSEDLQFMYIYSDFQVEILYHDISNQGETEKLKSKKSLINDDVNYLFDLVNGPLLKFDLVKINKLEHELILTVNHAICDGLSTDILLEELGVLYSAFCQDKIPTLSEPDRFSLFAEKENKFADSNEYKSSEEFWLNMYQESIPKLELPIDYPRPKLRTYNNHHLDFLLDNSLLKALKQIGNSAESKIFTSIVTTLVAAFEVFLCKQTGQNDLVLGLTSSRRANYDMMQMVGHTVNLLPLRSKVEKKIRFKDYLTQRNTQLFDAYDNQSISFGHLLEKLSIPRDPSRVPLVPVIINIQLDDVLESEHSFFNLSTKIKNHENNYGTFEIEIQAFMSNMGPCFRWKYNTTLFKSETIEQMMASFKEVLNGIVANPKAKIEDIIKVNDSAYTKLNDTLVSYPQLPFHKLLTNQAQISALKQAVKFGNSEISYENFEKQVNQLSHYLIKQGVKNGDFVAVSLPRSIELVVSLTAIMKCGAAYLPLDPNFPSQRIKFMLEDSESKYLITTKEFSSSFNISCKVFRSEDVFLNLAQYPTTSPNISVEINDIAYIIYTSGSTGKPKGVMVTHKNLVNFLCSMIHEPGISENDKLLSITTISFDIAGLELFLPLLKGATLVIASDETAKDSRLMLELLQNESITMLQATPSTWQMLLETGWEKPLPIKALSGGEALPMKLAKKILARVNELWNLYGPTETTIWSAVEKITLDDDVITIGHPIANTQLYIVNEQNHLAAPNTIGEICIAGDGVSKGYWKRPDLTDEKFITNPFETKVNSILYRTGDIGKLLHTGKVQCLGRTDNQVKIRGHRIELGEIEQIIDTLEGVHASVVIVKNDLLIANIISSQLDSVPENTVNEWKKILTEILPAYMVPQQFSLLSEFPITLNGKIDRKALKSITSINYAKPAFTIAQSNSEKIIENIWKESLGIDKIDINSDFFELGGHSILAVKVMALIEKQTGNRLPLASLIENPTIAKLAAYMDKKFISWDSLVPLKPNGNKVPLFIAHGANHNVLIYKNLAGNLDDDQPVYALQAKGLSGEVEPHKSVEEMASYYISEIKTIYPEGPYALGGFSFGGIIAFEMAKQLKAEGKKVKILALFDSYVYPSYYYSNPLVKKTVSTFYNIAQLIFMGLNMFSSKKNFKRRKDLLKIKIYGLYLRIKYGKEKQNQLQFNYSSKIDKMHALAFIRYNLIPQDIKVDLFRSTEDIYFAHDYKYLGWKSIALKGIRKHLIPGNHSEMFLLPAVKEVASILQKIMDSDDSESYE